jgi:hypothetical protein
VVRTPGFHPGNGGSIPPGVTTKTVELLLSGFCIDPGRMRNARFDAASERANNRAGFIDFERTRAI